VPEQNVTVALYYGGTWNTVPVYTRNLIRITRGTSPEGGDIMPATAELTIDNRTGTYDPSNPFSALYGRVGRNTPLRISVDSDVRFVGEVVSWKPRRSIEDVDLATQRGDAWVTVEAAGQLWRYGQGEGDLRSAYTRALLTTSPAAWWPLELDLAAETTGVLPGQIVASPVGPAVRQPLQLLTAGVTGAAALVDLSNGTRIDLPMPEHTLVPGTGYTVEFISRWQAVGPPSLSVDAVRLNFDTISSPGTIVTDRIQVETDNTGEAFLFAVDTNSGFDRDDAVTEGNVYDGASRHFRVRVYQDGADVDSEMYINGVLSASTTLPTVTLSKLGSISLNFVGDTGEKIPALGQVAVALSATVGPGAEAATGYVGEKAADRFQRLCDEEGITCTIIGDPDESKPMGPQAVDTLLNLFGDLQRTDDGLVYDTRASMGMTYRTGRSRLNQTSALDLTFPTHVAPPLAPDIDDLGTRNDITAKSPTGQSRSVEESGPMSVQAPPDGVGRTSTTVNVTPESDSTLPDVARWWRAKGTIPDPRYPRIVVDLVATPAIEADVEAVDIGDLMTLAGLPQGTARLHVPGYVEEIGSHTRTVAFITVPEAPYRIGVWTDDTPTNGEARWGASDTYLAEDLTTVETAADVDTGTDTWITTASHPSRFPLNVTIGGLTYSCTAITGTHPNLTLTLVRLPDDKTHLTGDQVWITDTFRWG
jgi:hypothetical protein